MQLWFIYNCKMKFLVILIAAFGASTALTITDTIHITPKKHGISGTGTTTRYWDCCKPACAWAAFGGSAVSACLDDGVTKADDNAASGCETGGIAYMCSNQESITVNDTFAMGFAAASFTGGVDTSYCCTCMLLSFQGAISGKQMVVQVTNTGSDLGVNHFDIAIPGGGTGIFSQGCSNQWSGVGGSWDVSTESDCDQLPSDLQVGCQFRFEFMQGASNPAVEFTEVDCPGQLTGITGCSA